MKTEFRIQNSESRSQDSSSFAKATEDKGFNLWFVALAAVLLAGCASPQVAQFTDADWVSHSTTARSCYERGDYRRAEAAYARAAQRARALDEADALAISAVNRAMCLLAEGRADAARAVLDEALADERVSTKRRTELLAASARADLALGQPDGAVAQADEVLASDPSPGLRAQALLAKSEAELTKEYPAAATKTLADGMSPKAWSRLSASLRAEQAALRADIAAAEQRPADAAALQDEAAGLWKQAGRLPDMARALAEGGRQAQAAGDEAGACDRFYRAARSLWAQGLQIEALRVLEEGVSCAEQLDDDAVTRQMAELFVTFKAEKRHE